MSQTRGDACFRYIIARIAAWTQIDFRLESKGRDRQIGLINYAGRPGRACQVVGDRHRGLAEREQRNSGIRRRWRWLIARAARCASGKQAVVLSN